MHNVKKVHMSEEKRALKRREDVERATQYNALSRAAMALRKERAYDEESLAACEKVLSINPEMTTLWNFRREILGALHPEGGADARKAACEREFKLTQACLGINPKSYPVAKVPAEAELKFTSDKVNANFSNYSAWHYRTKLLPRIHAADALGPTLREELQLVRSAFYCSPEDQSAWFYHRWLLAKLAELNGAAGGAAGGSAPPTAADEGVLRDELGAVRELLELEPGCKWPLLSAALLSAALDRPEEASESLEECRRVDPMRTAYYDHMLASGSA